MTQFGLTLWAYEVTGKTTPLALVDFFLCDANGRILRDAENILPDHVPWQKRET
jgi:hypothetical protein